MFPEKPPIILLGVYLSLADSVQRDLQNICINWWSYSFVECIDQLLNKRTSIAYTIHTHTHRHAQICKVNGQKWFYFVANLYLYCAWSYSTVVLKHLHKIEQFYWNVLTYTTKNTRNKETQALSTDSLRQVWEVR